MITPLVPMAAPDLDEQDIAAVLAVLRTSVLSIGPQVVAFEEYLAAYASAQFGIAVNSGTSGLHLGVVLTGGQPGDTLITTPFSFVASANSILYERMVPVFVDVDPATGNISPELVAEAAHDLSRGGAPAMHWLPPTLRESRPGPLRGLMPVHVFGQPADMDPLLKTAADHEIAVIEDACEAVGAEYRGRRVGALGDLGVFAFYPNKQMTTGEGGMIVTNRPDWRDGCRSLRNQGRDIFDAWLNHSRLGYNYRLDELSAALGLSQARRLDDFLERRSQVAAWYTKRLQAHPLVETPAVAATTTRMSWFVYVVKFALPVQRNAVMAALAEQGIPSRPYFSPVHLQPFYRQRFGYHEGMFPVTEMLGAVSLALPFSGVMTEAMVDLVCERLIDVLTTLDQRA